MALIEGCKHSVEISVPVEDVESETERVVAGIQKKAKLPGFRPGKTPLSLIRSRFASEIRQEVIQELVPKHFREHAERENLRIVGTPDIKDVHFEKGEPLRFRAEFELAPEFDLGEYRGVEVPYNEPAVTEEDISNRVEQLRDSKAEYVNVDARPLEDGDYAAVSLDSMAGLEGAPIHQEELTLHLGGEDTLPGFTENLRGASPGDVKEFDVTYPEDYGQERLAGKTIRFRVEVKAVRKKELPELNDEFAKDLGDFQNLEELREAIRKNLFAEREFEAQRDAKDAIVEKLVDLHEFPVPEAYLDRQIESQVENRLRMLAVQGVDPRSVQFDWEKIRSANRDKAIRDVRASLILEKIADREAIETTVDELDREVQRIARQEREPVAAVRMKLEKDGTIRRIASRIRTEKTLSLLFEQARKVSGE
ncbi:MAG: trigger factor [Bryobacterales bacterium]|nr:trigger factor [Bryobacterales bacterium]MEB2361329.1 trigger factor [Bryobacterales bacterium]